jgi:hypothetical protein
MNDNINKQAIALNDYLVILIEANHSVASSCNRRRLCR